MQTADSFAAAWGSGTAGFLPSGRSRFSHRDHGKAAIGDGISHHSATQLVHPGEHDFLEEWLGLVWVALCLIMTSQTYDSHSLVLNSRLS